MSTRGTILAVSFLLIGGASAVCVSLPALGGALAGRQAAQGNTEFGRLAAQLSQARLGGAEDNEKLLDQALTILDGLALTALNASATPDLDALNQRLASLATQEPPVGENYRVMRLGATPAVYALAANFGLGGPSAVRLYSPAAGRYVRSGRIDRFAQKDFFDENLELVLVQAPVVLFVTITGRTDDLQTGSFAAWLLDGDRLKLVWISDLLQQSTYESGGDGFRLTYCAQTAEENPRVCRRMVRDRFAWEGGAWKRAEQKAVPVPKR